MTTIVKELNDGFDFSFLETRFLEFMMKSGSSLKTKIIGEIAAEIDDQYENILFYPTHTVKSAILSFAHKFKGRLHNIYLKGEYPVKVSPNAMKDEIFIAQLCRLDLFSFDSWNNAAPKNLTVEQLDALSDKEYYATKLYDVKFSARLTFILEMHPPNTIQDICDLMEAGVMNLDGVGKSLCTQIRKTLGARTCVALDKGKAKLTKKNMIVKGKSTVNDLLTRKWT